MVRAADSSSYETWVIMEHSTASQYSLTSSVSYLGLRCETNKMGGEAQMTL